MAVKDYTGEFLNTLKFFQPDVKPINFSNVLDNYNTAYDKSYNKVLNNAYSDALASGDEDRASKIAAILDPAGERARQAALAQRAEDRQWALEDAERKQQNALELLAQQTKNAFALENLKNQNAQNLALFKAQNGIGTGGFVGTNPLDKKRIETIGKNMDENIAASQSRLDDYGRIEQLLQSPNVSTGGVVGEAKNLLPDGLLNQDTVELRSLIKKIVPQMRPTGSGTTSDRDMKVFEQATVGLGKDKDANLNIVRGRKLVDENNIAKEELRYQWLNMGGNLGDFDKEWRNYLNKNPIFSNQSGKLNANRKNAYEWFSGDRTTQETTSSDPLGLR
jgi:hypothetical protein